MTLQHCIALTDYIPLILVSNFQITVIIEMATAAMENIF